MRPLYIAVEGIEGCGKSTLCKLLFESLKAKGIKALLTREPGGTELGEKLRELLLFQRMHPLTELFLYLADRAEHIERVVRPALEEGSFVISDRCFLSTVAYQGYGRGLLTPEEIFKLCMLSCSGLTPHAVFIIDIPAEAALSRLTRRDRIEAEPLEFHERVRKGYLEAGRLIKNCHILDGRKTPEELLKEALKVLGI